MSSAPRRVWPSGLVLLALTSGAFSIGSSQAGAGAVVIEQARDLHTTVPLVGYSISGYALGVAISAPLMIILLTRWDRRTILQAMMAVGVVMNAGTALSPNLPTLMIMRFLAAIPHGVFLAAGAVVGSHVLGAKRRGRAMAIMMSGYTVAIVVAVPLMKYVSANVSWRVSYAFVSAAALVALVLVRLFVPSVPATGPTTWRRDLAHLRGPAVGAALAFCALGFAGFGVVFAYVVPILQDLNHLSVGQVTVVLSATGAAMTLGTLLGGKLTDISPIRSARISAVASLLCFVALAIGGATPVIAVVVVLAVNAATGLMSQGAQTHFMDVVHASPMLGAAMSHGSLNIANALGAAMGAVVLGAGFGYLATAWVAVAFTVVGGSILVVGPGFRTARVS
jgi:MFS transporter, DHA1 family, inner membrane transport protein